MSRLDEVFASLHDVILERFRAERGGAVGNAFVAFEFGTPIPDDTFRLKDPGRTLSPELAVEFMSQHANTVPEVKDMLFRRRPYTVEGQYGLMLAGASSVDAASMDMLGAIKRAAMADYDQTLGSLIGPYRYRPVYATPVNWYDESQQGNWTHVDISRSDTPPAAAPPINPKLRNWRIAPDAVKGMLAQPVSASNIERFPAAVIRQAALTRRSARLLDTASEFDVNATVLLRAQPAVSTAAVGTQLRTASSRVSSAATDLQSARLMRPLAVERPEPEPAIAAARVPIGSLIAADASWQLANAIEADTTEQPVVTDRFSISLDICLVSLRRPWVADALLTLPSWFVPGFKQGEFSQADEEEAGPFAVLPTACILIRNLAVTAQWSDQDSAAIEQSANLGGFALFGRTFDRNSATLSVQGMQSIAWVCEPMPTLPPASSP
ncbi:MAG: hypothetical protein ABW034_03140 [Steroidobacteraceae bacterium]